MEKNRKRTTSKGKRINARVGRNIRNERKLRDMSVEDLANLVALSPAFIGLIERGERGTTLEKLEIFCDVFQITLNDLVSTEDMAVSESNGSEDASLEMKRKTIHTYIYKMTSEELDFIITVVKDFKKFSDIKRD